MKRALFLFVALMFVVTAAASAQTTLGALLTGSQEVPALNSASSGTAVVTIDPNRASIAVELTVSSLGSSISGAHIHEAARGTNGSIVIDFLGAGSRFINGRLSGVYPISADLGTRLATRPQNFYVNVHTSLNPGGAIRGQLTPNAGFLQIYAGDLLGSNEVPANASTAAGAFRISLDAANTLIFDVNVPNIDTPTQAHIHEGAAGTNGSVVIGFTPLHGFTGGRIAGQFNNIDAGLADRIRANPSGFYVNVHTDRFPGGEVRGQLAPGNETDLGIIGRVTNAAGQLFVTDVRVFNPSFTAPATALLEFAIPLPGLPDTRSYAVSIPPRGTAVLDDVNNVSYLNAGGTGGLRVTSSAKVNLSARIFNDQRTLAKGTFGQFEPGIPREKLLRRGTLAQLSNKPFTADRPSGARTNIGFYNPNTTPVDVRMEVYDEHGVSLGFSNVVMVANGHQQTGIASYFTGVDLTNRENLTLTYDASAPLVVFASVVDNASGDQFFVVPQEEPFARPE